MILTNDDVHYTHTALGRFEMAKKLKEIIFDEYKLAMSLGRGQADLRVGVLENCPFMTVRTRVDGDANHGKIDANMDPKTWYALMALIRAVAMSNGPVAPKSVDNYGHPFINGQRSREKKIMSRTTVQKKEDGVIYISITAGSKRPVIEFPFLADEYHAFVGDQGQPMSPAEVSRYCAIGMVNIWEKMMAQVLVDHYAKPEWMVKREQQQQQDGGQQQNNYQQRQQPQQQNNYQQSQQSHSPSMNDFDDDILI